MTRKLAQISIRPNRIFGKSTMQKSGVHLLMTMFVGMLALPCIVTSISAHDTLRVERLSRKLHESYPIKEQQVGWAVFAQRKNEDGLDIAHQCAADLFALFGGKVAASAVERSRAKELLDCVRVLAPNSHHARNPPRAILEDVERVGFGSWRVPTLHRDLQKMVASPPAAVKELARKAVEWGGDPNVILNALGRTTYPVPDVEGSTEAGCTLTKYDDGKRFLKTDMTKYMAFLFEAIAALSPSAGLNISLNRFDLFHGHVFTAYNTGRLGILFHSREYPAQDENKFPLNLGFCQKGSTVQYDASMALRNIVWLAPMPDCRPIPNSSNETCSRKWLAPGSLFVLDTGEGKILDRELVPDYLDVVHTVSEDDLGEVMVDVNYFNFVDESPEKRVFMC